MQNTKPKRKKKKPQRVVIRIYQRSPYNNKEGYVDAAIYDHKTVLKSLQSKQKLVGAKSEKTKRRSGVGKYEEAVSE